MSSSKNFLLENAFKVTLQYFLNFLYYLTQLLTLNLKLKVDQKMCTLKNFEETRKTWKNFEKRVATL